MQWELDFLKKIGELGSQNPDLFWLSRILQIITFSVDKGIIWIIIGIVLICIRSKRKYGFILLVSLLVFDVLINNLVIKYLVQRIRPYDADTSGTILSNIIGTNGKYKWFFNYGESFLKFYEIPNDPSFMSGHSLASFLTATVIFKANKKWSIPVFIYATLVAFSRIYFGVHYPTDVICGSIAGILFGIIGIMYGELLVNPCQKLITNIMQKFKKSN